MWSSSPAIISREKQWKWKAMHANIWRKFKLYNDLFGPRDFLIVLHFFNTLRPRQDGRHFPDDTFECFFLNENV